MQYGEEKEKYEHITGNYSGKTFTVTHNLEKVPEVIIVKTEHFSGKSNGEIVIYNKFMAQIFEKENSGCLNFALYLGSTVDPKLNYITNITDTSFTVNIPNPGNVSATYEAFVCSFT